MRVLYTDGSCMPNPGPGGFAVIEVVDGVGQPVALGHDAESTNIRMEGSALIAAIKYTDGEECEIYTDSEFWINVLTKWAPSWKSRGWVKRSGPIKNLDLVKELYELYSERPVKLNWVRGHVGTEFNELADSWAGKAREERLAK